jgi:exopolysaccharide biosynthesis polyprenyl glycosylphosphotransferase
MDTLTNQNIKSAKVKKSKAKKIGVSRFTNATIPVLLMVGADIVAFTMTFLVQFWLRFKSGIIETHMVDGVDKALIILAIFGLFNAYWLAIFFIGGMYKNWYEWSPFDEIWNILKFSILGWLIGYFAIMLDSQGNFRGMILTGFGLFVGFVVLFRFFARKIQKSLRKRKIIRFNSIVFGCRDKATDLIAKIKQSIGWGYVPVSFVEYNEDESLEQIKEKLGSSFDFHKPDTLLITTGIGDQSKIFDIANYAASKNLRVKIEPDLYHIFTGQTKAHNIYGIPLIEISPQLLKPWQEFTKRLFDLLFSTMVIILGLPLWILLAIGVKIDSPGPVFYKQIRVGKNGREFYIYKFRSMRQSSDKTQRWTTVGDKRVTKWGKLIRKTHLDEIPQFWNVLKGDMSIVGPRPEQPHFVRDFSEEISYYNRRHVVRPGITGWWQINYGQYEISIDEIKNRTKDDFFYIENMSIKLDLEIVTRTVWCVIKGHGQA